MKEYFSKNHKNSSPLCNGMFFRLLVCSVLILWTSFFTASSALADANFTVTPISGPAPLTVTATYEPVDCICDFVEISWGDGDSTGMMFPPYSPVTHTYTSAGTYTVQASCGGDNPTLICNPQRTVTVSGGADATPPAISITSPTSSSSYTTNSTPVTLGGNASDNVGVTQVTWTNSQGGSGTASGTTSWTAAGISLQPGDNTITVTARDAANNTGTDQITVTYNPPSGAFNVSASPGSAGVVPNQQNVLSFVYTAAAPGGGSFALNSSEGRFTAPGGNIVETVSRTISINLINGSGTASETVSVPSRVITAAQKAGNNRILYERTFSYGGESSTIQVTLLIVPSSAGPFSLVRLAMRFETNEGFQESFGPDVTVEKGRATVPRNFKDFKAVADITYNGGGLLQAQWKVDGQILGYITQYLYRGVRQVSIESPPVPGLPTYDTGQHRVELEINRPYPGFDEPEIFYFVTEAEQDQSQPPPAEGGRLRFENLEITKNPQEQGFFRRLLPGPPYAYAAEGTGEFAVNKGDVLTLKAALVNETGSRQHNIKVEFVVDGQVVDASFINMIEPGQTLIVEGEYTARDAKSHSVEIRARDAGQPDAEPLASIRGDMQGAADEGKGPAEEFDLDTISIAGFTLEIQELTNPDTNSLTGSGVITDIPFPGGTGSIQVEFELLEVDENGTVVQGSVNADIDDIAGLSDMEYASVDIDSITFLPDSALCAGTIEIPMPFAVFENRLQMGFNNLIMDHRTGLSGEVPFEQQNIGLSALLPGFGISLEPGSKILFTENELDSEIKGSVSLPGGILEIPGIGFTGFSFASDGGFYGEASLNAANISGTQLSIGGSAVLDFTTADSPGELSGEPEWMGVYLESGSLGIALFQGEKEFELDVYDLYIKNGLNGSLETNLNESFQTGEGSYQFELALVGLGISFHRFRAGSGSLEGNILGNVNIPVVDVAADIEFIISPDGIESVATLSEEKSARLAEMIELKIQQGSSVSVSGNLFEARLVSKVTALGDLGGEISAGLGATLVINSNGELSLEDPQGELAMWVGTQNCKADFFDVFSLGLDKVGFGIQGGHAFFGVGGSLCIMDGFEADAGATMGVNIPGGKVWARDIHVAFEEPGAFSFSGEVTLLDDAEFGNGFRGEMELSVVDTFSAESVLIAGHTGNFPYFYIDGSIQIPAPGIQLNPYPVAFFGFGGGAYFNMEPDTFDGDPESYTPEEGSLGLISTVTVGTSFDNGYTFNGDVTFEIAFDLAGGDRGFDLAMRGESYLLCERMQRSINRRIYTDATFGCHEGSSCAFTSRMLVEDFAVVNPDKAVVAVTSEMDMKLAEDEWYFYMGTPEQPSTVDILPTWVDISGHGYFTADSTGLAAGLGMEVDTGKKTILIFYGRLWGGMESDFAVNFKPAFIYAEFSVWMGLEAGLDFHELGKFELIKAYAELNGGLRTPSPTRLWVRGRLEYSVLGGMFSGTWKMSFTWGEPVPEMYDPEAVWPCVDSVIPEHNTQEVTVATAVEVVLTQPEGIGNRLTFPVESGETFYVGIEVEDVVVNTSAASLENPVPGDIVWNEARTRIEFIPDGYLYPNTDYYIHVEARAEGSPEMIEGGSWEDHYTAGFTTGGFPENLTPMVKFSHPYQGQKNWYTGYPIEVAFKRPLDFLGYEHVRGRLFKLSDNTEIPGEHSVFQPYANGVRFIPDAPLEPNTKYVYKLMRMTPETDPGAGDEEGGMQPAQTVGTMGGETGSGLTVAGTETMPHRTSGSQTTTPTATPQGDTMAHPADEEDAGLPPGDMPQAGDVVEAMNDVWLTIAFETGGYESFRRMLNASDFELNFEAKTLPLSPVHHPLVYLDRNPRYVIEGWFETAEQLDWSQVDIAVEPINQDYTTCGWDVEFYNLSDEEQAVLEPGPRCAGRTMNEKLIVRKSEEGSGSDGYRNQFVLELMPGQFGVVPVPNEMQDSTDLWDRQLTNRASMIDHRPEATELHEALLSETRITMRHEARPEEPYQLEINLLEKLLARFSGEPGPRDDQDSGFTFDGARPQKPPADIEPDVDADDSGGQAEDGDTGSQDDAGDTGASGPVFDGQPPARGE